MAFAALLLACSGGGSDAKLRVGQEPDDRGGGSAGVGSGAGQVGDGGIASGGEALSVRVQDVEKMTIEVITLACAGDCADVEAVARGGNPPYAFEWEDGSTKAKRRVCLDASTTLAVEATDTAIESDEFPYTSRTVRTEVDAAVLTCDGDAGPPGSTDCVFANPSFEGTPASNVSGKELDAPPWQPCDLTPDVSSESNESGTGGQPPTDGETYLYLGVATFLGSESVGQALCAPLRAGETLYVSADLQAYVPGAGAALQIYGSTSSACGEDELLGESAVVTDTTKWSTVCFALQPTAEHKFAKVLLKETLGGALVDNLAIVPRCP